MSCHYPKGFIPQTYGERKLADSMSTKAIQREMDKKKKMKKENPKLYRKIYCGMGFGK